MVPLDTPPASTSAVEPALPRTRGPLTEALFARLTTGDPLVRPVQLDDVDPLVDDDLHLALWCCYELHHHGFAGVVDDMEWDAQVLEFRAALEGAFESALRDERSTVSLPQDPRLAVRVITRWAGTSLSGWMEDRGSIDHLREFAIHRSAYQLKEADGHTWGIPRLRGPGRSAYIEIQSDEYGEGRPGEAHCELFADGMRDLGLCPDFGAYLDRLPGPTLATDNLISLFGLHRRNRGCLIGHLTLFEVTSVTPMSRYLSVVRRCGHLPSLERFYAVHVEADAHHGQLALDQMMGGFLKSEPSLAEAMVFGAVALSRVENRFTKHLVQAWDEGRTSLLGPAGTPVEVPVASPRPEVHSGSPA